MPPQEQLPSQDKINAAYVWFANAVASEGEVADHARRLKIARLMLATEVIFANFIRIDFESQGFTHATPQASYNDRLSALATNLVALGFGD